MANLKYLSYRSYNCNTGIFTTATVVILLSDTVYVDIYTFYQSTANCNILYEVGLTNAPVTSSDPGIPCNPVSYPSYSIACSACADITTTTTTTTTSGPTTTTTTSAPGPTTTTTTTTSAPTTTTTTLAPILYFHQDPYTISFDEVNNSFESFYSYYPEMMGNLNTTLFSFKNGAIWKHTSNVYCNFYGTQYPATITTVFNTGALDKKTWISLMETGNTTWKCPVISTQMDSYASVKQSSVLIDSDFEVLESEYHASFLRDINSIGGILEGNSLKGGYIVIKFEKTNANSFVYLNSATVKFIDSSLNNR